MQSIIKFIFSAVLLCIGFSVVYAQTSNTIIPPAYTTFFDQNGHPLSGGSVYFYVPLTTTPKGTYQDAAGTLPNTQPVVLDAAGKALILGFGSYRQIVFDKNNNQIWDQTVQSVGGNSNGDVVAGDGLSVGTVLPWTGFVAPTNYAFAYGQTLSRTTNAALMSAITQSESMTCQGGNATLSAISDTSQVPIGAVVEIPCMAAGSSVISKTSTSLTLTNMASVNLTTTGVIFPYGDGDQSTTFTLPDYRGKYLPGRCNMGGAACTNLVTPYFGTNTASALAASGGLQNSTLATANLPAYTPSGAIANGTITLTNSTNIYSNNAPTATAAPTGALGFSTANIGVSQASSTFTGVAQGGVATPLSIIPPSETINYIIKILPDIFTSGYSQILGISPIVVNTAGTVATVSLNPAAVTGLPNSALNNSSVTVNGTSCVLGASCSVAGSAITILPPVRLATTISLAVNTYNNGASGVGATITENAHGALTIDGVAANTNDVVLIKNEVTQANNGIYTVTNAGSGGASFVLTRISYFNQASNMLAGSYVLVTAGNTNANNSYVLQNTITTVGTTAVVFNLFSSGGGITNNNVVNSISNVTALRSNTSVLPAVYLQGYTSVGDGGEGDLNYIASDVTTIDNNCTIFVDAAGHRFYRSFINNISVKWCGAKGDGTTDDTTAIQNAINAARAYGSGVSKGGLCVTWPVPNPSYIMSSLNATLWPSGCMQGPGGSQAVTIYASAQASSLPILDLTSSPGFFIQNLNFYATTTGGSAPSTLPSVGVLLTPGVGLSDTDLIRFNFVQFTGFYTTAACYLYSVTDIRFDSANCIDQNLSAGYGMVASATNIFGQTSPYTTTGTGIGVMADLTWAGATGGLGSYATSSAGLLLSACQGCRFRDGVFAAGGSSYYIELQGINQALAFENIQLNEAVVTAPLDVFFLSSTTITGMDIMNIQAGGQYSSLLIGGSGSTCIGCAIVGINPSLISGGESSLFSHLP